MNAPLNLLFKSILWFLLPKRMAWSVRLKRGITFAISKPSFPINQNSLTTCCFSFRVTNCSRDRSVFTTRIISMWKTFVICSKSIRKSWPKKQRKLPNSKLKMGDWRNLIQVVRINCKKNLSAKFKMSVYEMRTLWRPFRGKWQMKLNRFWKDQRRKSRNSRQPSKEQKKKIRRLRVAVITCRVAIRNWRTRAQSWGKSWKIYVQVQLENWRHKTRTISIIYSNSSKILSSFNTNLCLSSERQAKLSKPYLKGL